MHSQAPWNKLVTLNMSVTFGSVGDIISVCLLVKDLVIALDKTRGSKAEYQATIRELWILDRALLEIDLLTRQHGSGATPELRSLCETAKQAVSRCQELVSDFLARIRKYDSAFDGKGSKLKEAAMGIRWRVEEKDALEQFRVNIVGTSSSLQLLLVTAIVTLLGVNRKEITDKLNETKRISDTANSAHDAALECIKDRIDLANQNIEAGNSILCKFTKALRMKWLRQLGYELKSLMCSVIAGNVLTYEAIMRLQASLPGSMDRGLIEEPAVFQDPLGRISPIHLQFITSWDTFHAVLESRFQHMPGFNKVKQRHYLLWDVGKCRQFKRSRPWQSTFLPGKKVTMSFCFRAKLPLDFLPEYKSQFDSTFGRCSKCGESADIPGSEYSTSPIIHCKKCSYVYQVADLFDEKMLFLAGEVEDEKTTKEHPASMLSPYERRHWYTPREEDDPNDFQRNVFLGYWATGVGPVIIPPLIELPRDEYVKRIRDEPPWNEHVKRKRDEANKDCYEDAETKRPRRKENLDDE
ncbi:vegetative cell wall gp1 [Pyrenophora seminiperda CCB06]|uniref:Vegetative cell wall gp1 n=1 Tax=Pyrenophora seminiperda CCB06 TaxID=1302712 RepID=A0A3M7MA59_9PLEO|nr:vegetative cell wall gp1 [Pyrenophora seminiperda CCB06]